MATLMSDSIQKPTSEKKRLVETFSAVQEWAARAGLDGFILALGCVILLAALFPAFGAQTGAFSPKEMANYGVSVVFLFYGLRLSPEKLRHGLSNWRLHLVVQVSTFVLFPLLMLAFRGVFVAGDGGLLWLGAFYLAALPSTVSSSVVMVSIAGGNMPAAIFNASVSSLLGVFITPLWMGLFLAAQPGSYDLGSVIAKLALQVLAPVVIGILLHRHYGAFAEKHRKKLRYFDQSVILLIVYTSFCDSFINKAFEGVSLTKLFFLGGCMTGLFLLMYGIISLICRMCGFMREDRITALFCGSKKSLVHGTVMSKVLFAGNASAGVILLPLMLYHALQLIAASIIAQNMAKRHAPKTTPQKK